MRRLSLFSLLSLLFVLPAVGVTEEDHPGLWPADLQAFWLDGPALLMNAAEREQFLALDEQGRRAFVADFLADPLPETPANELELGIQARMALARQVALSPADTRFQFLFLHGAPTLRQEVDCGQAYKPLEVWTFPVSLPGAQRAFGAQAKAEVEFEAAGKSQWGPKKKFKGWDDALRLVVYRPTPTATWRLWEPYIGKSVLYSSEMQYLLQQADELVGRRHGYRFDRDVCKETRDVEEATGVEGLRGFLRGRPTREAVLSVLEAPDDLGEWARLAASELSQKEEPVLALSPLQTYFPEAQGQRMVTRFRIDLAPDAGFMVNEEGDLKLAIDGVLESGDEIFEELRFRFAVPEAEGGPVVLTFDRALRPGSALALRLKVRDETSGAVGFLNGWVQVPKQPVPEHQAESLEEAVLLGESLAAEAARRAAQDSLILAPPVEGQVVLGIWRAETLVTGSRIAEVSFFVDGVKQLTRKRPPFTAEVRLATYPSEQVVRAEGRDRDGELVAFDEIIVNQPRGSFRVRVIDPARGTSPSGKTTARAEVVVPDDRRVDRVEFRVNEDLVLTKERPPWIAEVEIPSGEELTYISVVAYLDDGQRAEEVRFINAPRFMEEVDVKLVELYATVQDRSGRLATELSQDDFTVLEDGRKQEIRKFELVRNLPLTVGITIDTSGSMASTLSQAQAAGRAFLESVVTEINDRCFVVGFSAKPVLLMPPTEDVVACSEGLQGLQAVGWTALHDALVTSLYYLRDLQGQRALILLSDGDDTASGIKYAQALDYAQKSGVTIYTIGIDSDLNPGALGPGIRRKLNQLARDTGGRSFYVDDIAELNAVYDQIEQELRSRYLLAYSPDRSAAEGGYREIEIKMSRRGLKARTIAGYYP